MYRSVVNLFRVSRYVYINVNVHLVIINTYVYIYIYSSVGIAHHCIEYT